MFLLPTQSVFWAAIFSTIVLVVFLFEYRRVRARLFVREEQMKHRMYELSILRELGERIGYSLNVEKIVDIISGSLEKLLPYSTVSYMLPGEENRLIFHTKLAESVNKPFIAEVKTRMLKAFSALMNREYGLDEIDESVAGVVTDPGHHKKVESFFNIPIVINDQPAGILNVASTTPGLYKSSEEVEILYTIMGQAQEAVSKLQTVLEIEKGKLNAMVASMADGMIMVDKYNKLLVINPKAKQMLGVKNQDPTIFDVLDATADRFDLRTKIEESLKQDKLVIEDDIQLGTWVLQILISPVKDKKHVPLGTVVLLHDITHEKELEKMREDFTSMMVHELRSPLTGIRSIASLLKNDKIKNEHNKYQEFIDLIATNSNSMLELVNDLLDVAKLESGKFEVFKRPTDLRLIIRQRIESFTSLAQDSKITLESLVTAEVPEILPLDDIKIGQVLNNLISNALKFTEAGGRVTVGAFVGEKDQDLAQTAKLKNFPWQGLRHGVTCEQKCAVLSVSDTGMGISPTELPKLFNKFQQLSTAARSEKKGTGLGLVIVKGIAEAHGGQVGVFSEEGRGTTFYFTLPFTESAINDQKKNNRNS